MTDKLSVTSLILCAAVSPLFAATTPLGTFSDDPLNYASFTGTEMQSVTLNGITYSTSQLTQIELTAFKGASGSVFLQQNGATATPTAQERLDFLQTDWLGDTGIINPSTDANSSAANFVTPVKNVDGPDMFVYEITSNPSSADGFQININGVTLSVARSSYGDSGASTFNDDVLSLSGTPNNLTQLLTFSSSRGASDITQTIVGVGIDFSDFGVALGDTVSSFTFNSTTANGSSTFDPVIIAAVPEPSTYALLSGMCALTVLIMRRRAQATRTRKM